MRQTDSKHYQKALTLVATLLWPLVSGHAQNIALGQALKLANVESLPEVGILETVKETVRQPADAAHANLGGDVKTSCPQDNICPGNTVIDVENNIGTVVYIFDGERVKMEIDRNRSGDVQYNQYKIQNIINLSKSYKCIADICQGRRVLDLNNKEGTIEELFDNGKIRVVYSAIIGYETLKVFHDTYRMPVFAYTSKIRTFNDLGINLNCRPKDTCSKIQ